MINLFKKACEEIKTVIRDREELEDTLETSLPNTNVSEIEKEINEIDDFVEVRIIELQILSKKRLKQRFSNKFPK